MTDFALKSVRYNRVSLYLVHNYNILKGILKCYTHAPKAQANQMWETCYI